MLLSADCRDTFLCDFGLSETADEGGRSGEAFRGEFTRFTLIHARRSCQFKFRRDSTFFCIETNEKLLKFQSLQILKSLVSQVMIVNVNTKNHKNTR